MHSHFRLSRTIFVAVALLFLFAFAQAPSPATNVHVNAPLTVTYYYTGTLRQPTCSDASIDSAISSSVSGDIVRMASACSSFTATINIPNTKGILFDGNGSVFNSSSTILVDPNSTKSTRITNFTITCHGSVGNATVEFDGTATSAPWRMDNVTFLSSSHECIGTHSGNGLMDHITAAHMAFADEFIHFNGTGQTSQAANTYWQDDLTPGQSNQIYVEDSTWTTPTSEGGFAELQRYYGARVVIRYNTFNWLELDAHGGGGGVAGTRWSEVIKNVFNGNSNSPGGRADSIRAGSGIWYGNTHDASGPDDFGFCTEGTTGTGPINSQPGYGKNMTPFPNYSFLNTSYTNGVNECAASGLCGDCVAFNRDVYTDINSASCTAGGSCTAGVGSGTTLPTTCTTGVAFWKTDAGGNWDTAHGGANDGALYKCTSTNTWTLYYTPYTYPNPLQSSLNTNK